MAHVASSELRNNTAALLRRAEAGEEIVITVAGRPVAALVSVDAEREHRTWISKSELIGRLRDNRADPGLRNHLATLAQSTDELSPIQ